VKERELPEWFYQGALLLSRDSKMPWHVLYYGTDEHGTVLSVCMRRGKEDKVFPIRHVLDSFRPVPGDWEGDRLPSETAAVEKPRAVSVQTKPERYKQFEF
jgi:hypothetical protein